MDLIDKPDQLVTPFAESGNKATIPVDSQIGITGGKASYTTGFPPLTMTPKSAGGIPPFGVDMNGVLFDLSGAARWNQAGGGYPYNSVFVTDPLLNGYPKGARVLRADSTGYWLNLTDGNVTDPDGAGAAAAGWVPDTTNGIAAVTMTSTNVTLTSVQYGKPIIVITGLLTTNLNLIFPNIAGSWIIINNTTGTFTITAKTSAGTGVTIANGSTYIVGDATNIYYSVTAVSSNNIAVNSGSADALVGVFTPAPASWVNGVPYLLRAAAANTTTTPTFTANSGTLTAKTIVKGSNKALVAGDIAGAGQWLYLQYDTTLDKVVLLNPARGVNIQPQGVVQQVTGTNTSYTDITANIPYDDTIPQIGEGIQILTASITPTSASNSLEISVLVSGSLTSSSGDIATTLAIFKDAGANSISSAIGLSAPSGTLFYGQISINSTVSAGSNIAQTYTVRVGVSGTGHFYLNGSATSRLLGGTVSAYIIIKEIQA